MAFPLQQHLPTWILGFSQIIFACTSHTYTLEFKDIGGECQIQTKHTKQIMMRIVFSLFPNLCYRISQKIDMLTVDAVKSWALVGGVWRLGGLMRSVRSEKANSLPSSAHRAIVWPSSGQSRALSGSSPNNLCVRSSSIPEKKVCWYVIQNIWLWGGLVISTNLCNRYGWRSKNILCWKFSTKILLAQISCWIGGQQKMTRWSSRLPPCWCGDSTNEMQWRLFMRKFSKFSWTMWCF